MLVGNIKFNREVKTLMGFAFVMNIDIFYHLYPLFIDVFHNHEPNANILVTRYYREITNVAISFISTIIYGVFFYSLYLYLRSKDVKIPAISIILIISGMSLVTASSVFHFHFMPDLEENSSVLISKFRLFVWYFARAAYMGIISAYVANLIFTKEKDAQQRKTFNKLVEENYKCTYGMLHEQIKPHFLFNSINTLNAIIDNNPVKAKIFVHKLTNLLSYSLTEKELSPYEKEIEIAKSYAYLMEIRFGSSLNFVFETSSVSNKYLPIFSLQVLLENAVKHNAFTDKKPIVITIESLNNEFIKISNPIRKKNVSSESSGIGLHNLSQRFKLLANKDIEIFSDGNTFSVTIPLIEA